MAKDWKATLNPAQVLELWAQGRKAFAGSDRLAQRAVDAAIDETSEILGAELQPNGETRLKVPQAAAEYAFSANAVMGFRMALSQAISGVGQQRVCESRGRVRDMILPLADALRIGSYVRKDAGMDGEEPEAEAMVPDGEEVLK